MDRRRSAAVVRAGVRIAYDVSGVGGPTVLLLPPWMITHSGVWREQVPVLAARSRVVTYDARGSGRSDRPREAAAYQLPELVADTAGGARGERRRPRRHTARAAGRAAAGSRGPHHLPDRRRHRRPRPDLPTGGGRALADLLDAQFVPLPGAGHIPAVTSAVEVTAIIQCVTDASERSLT